MTQDFAQPYFSFAKYCKNAQKDGAMNKAELIEAVQKEMGADTTKPVSYTHLTLPTKA